MRGRIHCPQGNFFHELGRPAPVYRDVPMKEPLKQFVPSTVCLECDGCCRFKESDSDWRPHISPEEIAAVGASGLAAEIFSKHPFSAEGRVQTAGCGAGGEHLCAFFNPADSTCRIYGQRPFDCELYPFVLVRKANKTMVCVHLNCPHIQQTIGTPEYKQYVKYLQGFFQRPETLESLRKNPALAGDYPAYLRELKELFVLSI